MLCWLPSHVGIKGNEAADVKAKSSLDLDISNLKVPFVDFKPFIDKYILSKWQMSWKGAMYNKLHEIKPVLGNNIIGRPLRREDVVLTRLRIGHTIITHSYLIKQEDQPLCISCNKPFTVKHFLIDCFEFANVRRHFFHTNDMRQLVIDKPWLLSRFWVYCKLYHSLVTFHCLTPNEAEPSLGQTVKGHQIMI